MGHKKTRDKQCLVKTRGRPFSSREKVWTLPENMKTNTNREPNQPMT
jgi:hypothetical protein